VLHSATVYENVQRDASKKMRHDLKKVLIICSLSLSLSFSFSSCFQIRSALSGLESHEYFSFLPARLRKSDSCIAADMLLQLAAVTFSHTCSPLHLPMIREAFRFVLSSLRVQHSFRGETVICW